jgi:hypothetical protein
MAGYRKRTGDSYGRRQAAPGPHPGNWLSGVWQTIAPAPTTARRKRARAMRVGNLRSSAALGLLLAVAGCAPDVAIAGLLRLMGAA